MNKICHGTWHLIGKKYTLINMFGANMILRQNFSVYLAQMGDCSNNFSAHLVQMDGCAEIFDSHWVQMGTLAQKGQENGQAGQKGE